MDNMDNTHKLNRKLQKNLSEYHLQYIEMQDCCSLCGTDLNIETHTYAGSDTLKEEASCPSCKVKIRVKSHKVQ